MCTLSLTEGMLLLSPSAGDNALSGMVTIPVMVARGMIPGNVVGITAALHGNELNGIPLIHT